LIILRHGLREGKYFTRLILLPYRISYLQSHAFESCCLLSRRHLITFTERLPYIAPQFNPLIADNPTSHLIHYKKNLHLLEILRAHLLPPPNHLTTSAIMTTKPTLGGALFAAPTTDAPGGEEQEQQQMEGHELLDPLTSERCYWRDPLTGTQREIWRPGRLFAKSHIQCTKANI
jgi:hypothetical protein